MMGLPERGRFADCVERDEIKTHVPRMALAPMPMSPKRERAIEVTGLWRNRGASGDGG